MFTATKNNYYAVDYDLISPMKYEDSALSVFQEPARRVGTPDNRNTDIK
jgi:hypothetical protein